jgi:hypothetical protein
MEFLRDFLRDKWQAAPMRTTSPYYDYIDMICIRAYDGIKTGMDYFDRVVFPFLKNSIEYSGSMIPVLTVFLIDVNTRQMYFSCCS